MLVGLYLTRRISAFPGTQALVYIIPSYAIAFSLVGATIFILRLPYSRSLIVVCFLLCIGVNFAIGMALLRGRKLILHLVPTERAMHALGIERVDWTVMTEPLVPRDPSAAIVADLHHDHAPAWERMLAMAAISGRPVYHVKQIEESLTGRVQIEHLSENSFGSLIPSLAYRKLKRGIDLALSAALLPVLVVPMLLTALLIKLDSPGPVLFRQTRMGFRGKPFQVLKFRSMTTAPAALATARDAAITQQDDKRVTRVGRVIRRTRIDELPQILNVLRGDMSWIGPRPEAIPLSEWYEAELPFYVYRHIVRPGITGWAQVNQGHVADLEDVRIKLHYDFYYIKNFSAWLDLLIVLRTIRIVVTGFGAR